MFSATPPLVPGPRSSCAPGRDREGNIRCHLFWNTSQSFVLFKSFISQIAIQSWLLLLLPTFWFTHSPPQVTKRLHPPRTKRKGNKRPNQSQNLMHRRSSSYRHLSEGQVATHSVLPGKYFSSHILPSFPTHRQIPSSKR